MDTADPARAAKRTDAQQRVAAQDWRYFAEGAVADAARTGAQRPRDPRRVRHETFACRISVERARAVVERRTRHARPLGGNARRRARRRARALRYACTVASLASITTRGWTLSRAAAGKNAESLQRAARAVPSRRSARRAAYPRTA